MNSIPNIKNFFLLTTSLLLFISQKSNAQQIIISEFMASNVTTVPEIVDYDDYPDWIEIYNNSDETINLTDYAITDDLNDSAKWIFPGGALLEPKSYLLLWADGHNDSPGEGIKYYHMNFKISQDGEEIGIFSPGGVLVDSVTFGSQLSDVSYGRKENELGEWYYFGEPTPGKANTTEGVKNKIFTPRPEISLDAGFYTGNQVINIIGNSVGKTIKYTTDGSQPRSTSKVFSDPIQINKNSVFRFRAFEYGKLPSRIVTKTYFIDQQQTLPVISLTILPETFFDEEIGIYDNQIKGIEVPVNVQYFEKGGEFAFEVDAGVRLTGQASFQYPQKPLTIELDNRYGYETINYPVFSNRPFKDYTSLYLRNSGTQDHRHTLFRDALQHTIVINQMDIDCQAYQPAAAFINGEYWGIYNLREKLDNDYLVNHHKVNPDNIDYLEYEFSADPIVIEGNKDDYFALQNFLSYNSMNNDKNWEYVKSQIDINEVMNYLITEIYCDNYNWPNTNSRWWREKADGGKWRYIFLDSDFGFGAPSWNSHYTNNTLEFMYSQPPFSTLVFRKLLTNTDFKNEFIQRFATYLNTVLSRERVLSIFDSLKAQIDAEMVNHIDRWNDDPTPIFNYPPIPNMEGWNYEVDIMREFASERNRFMKLHIEDFFNLQGTSKVELNVNLEEGGYIEISSIKIKNGFSGDYYNYVPVKIKAVPAVGYKFVSWTGDVADNLDDSTSFFPTRSDSTKIITAVFEENIDVSIIPSVIDKNTILTNINSPYAATGDIIINPGIKLTVEPGVLITMPANSSIFVRGEIEINGTEESPSTIAPNRVSGFSEWGIIYLDSASGSSTFKNLNIIGATQILDADSGKIGAISSYKSDLTLDGVSIENSPFPVFTRYGNIVVRNSKFHSEEICDLINIKYAETALVENCDFRGNNAYDTDAIDYDQISNGVIRNNKIYNFYGFNSDGIDLGEGSKNVLIENNMILNCADKGISVGQASTAEIKGNIILSCAQGVGIKDDSSYAFIDRNTFYNCNFGVASFEKNIGAGGGHAQIVNSIFSQSKSSPVFVDNLSILNITYSLSDTEELDGTGNIYSHPKFLNNFFLDPSSPAIDSGDPASGADPDGSPPDIGARFYSGLNHPLIINEIHYYPTENSNEFIEIYNSGSAALDVSGYKIKGAIEFEFPQNYVFQAKAFMVITNNPAFYINLGTDAYEWDRGPLPDNEGNIILLNNENEEIDFVSYSNKHNWPVAADGGGYSLELKGPEYENAITENWKVSSSTGGSPGKENRAFLKDKLFINELQADNSSTITDEFGEFDDWIELYNAGNEPVYLGNLHLTDDLRNLTKHKYVTTNSENDFIRPGGHKIIWADNDTDQGNDHISFRLKSSGEEIAIVYVFDKDTLIIDSVSFDEQITDFSYGRKTDGGNDWGTIKSPTPGERNNYPGLFENGILLVNGYRLGVDEVINFYDDRALWGNYEISFWDLFPKLSVTGYPDALPEPSGHGPIPLEVLLNYSTVIWTGENNASEVTHYLNTPLLRYVKMGGNLLLLLKNGIEYIDAEMLQRLGITWIEKSNPQIMSCIPAISGLDTISIKTGQYLSALFNTELTNSNSKLLFTDNEGSTNPTGVGVWNKPEYGGWYKGNGGQMILLNGRGYRYDSEDLIKNMEYIFENFFEEPDVISDSFGNEPRLITRFSLDQNYPNPFNPVTVIKYDLVESVNVELKVYDILGREVKTLVNKYQEKGRRTAIWNGDNNFNNKVSSGIYFYRISAGGWTDIKKMILLR